jgi:histidyl-tRNA synthetase
LENNKVRSPIQSPRGTKDVLPADAAFWHEIEQAVATVAEAFGYSEIRTPIFEVSRLFKRSVGEETDIVSKEMYLFEDKGGEEFALRPELTAPVVRAAIEHSLITGQTDCARLYYNSAPNFRYEKPQLGRFRQFHQFGTELLGPASPLADAETISFAISIYRKLGLRNFRVRLNSLASPAARDQWKAALVPYLRQNIATMSKDSQRRTETNPMRVLDSKAPEDQEIIRNAPIILDYLDTEDKEHFESLQNALRAIDIDFIVDPLLVRGFDYYTRTVFEITSSDLGSQDALCGGGRYDNLVEQLGGPPTPAVGFAAGVERLLIVLQKLREKSNAGNSSIKLYVVAQSAAARSTAFKIAGTVRVAGVPSTCDLNDRSMKAQMRDANRVSADYVYIIGDSELAQEAGLLKNMQTGEQQTVPFDHIVSAVN